jgi:hypothetical protein
MYFDKPMKDHSLVQAIARVTCITQDAFYYQPPGLSFQGVAVDNIQRIVSVVLTSIYLSAYTNYDSYILHSSAEVLR